MNPLRVEARIRNNILWHLIFDNFRSVQAFCKEHSLHIANVGNLLNLKMNPKRKDGEYRELPLTISNIFSLFPEYIFPEELYDLEKTEISKEIPILQLDQTRRELQLPSPSEVVIQNEAKYLLNKNMKERLSDRDREILEKRFGFHGEILTYKDIGGKYGISGQRVKQIEENAISKLKRSKDLRGLRKITHL